jgi:hypothetical protein
MPGTIATLWAAEQRGELAPGTAHRWAHNNPGAAARDLGIGAGIGGLRAELVTGLEPPAGRRALSPWGMVAVAAAVLALALAAAYAPRRGW